MTVKELKEKLNALPLCYDDFKVVSFQAQVRQADFDELKFDGFDDIELKRVHLIAEQGKVRIN